MAVELTSTNFNGQNALVTLYLPTGTTIPYNAATSVNIGLQNMPFTYEAPYIAWEYGQFVLDFTGSSKVCLARQLSPPDGDGNVYDIIEIGTQVWMAENLKTTKFQDGTPLSNTSQVSNTTWAAATASDKYWALVNNNSANTNIYGLLYNHYAVTGSTTGSTASVNLCPVGYHAASTADFNTLITFLGGLNSAGSAKYPGTSYWYIFGNVGATNTSGLSIVGNGLRYGTGGYDEFKYAAYLWHTNSTSRYTIIYSLDTVWDAYNGGDQRLGMGVRCLKD
jgi:uncharacterized protein (TIGR02145 family)